MVVSSSKRGSKPVAERNGAGPRILTVGRLVERKGFQDVIRATALVPDAECVVVGGPPAGLLETPAADGKKFADLNK